MNLSHAGTMTKVLDTQLKKEELISREDPGKARRGKSHQLYLVGCIYSSKEQEKREVMHMAISFFFFFLQIMES